MNNRVLRITKYRADWKPKDRKVKGGPKDNCFANMSVEEFGELLDQDMSEPVILEGMATAEVHKLTQEWTGWSVDDIAVLADTSAIALTEHEQDSARPQQEEVMAEDMAELEG